MTTRSFSAVARLIAVLASLVLVSSLYVNVVLVRSIESHWVETGQVRFRSDGGELSIYSRMPNQMGDGDTVRNYQAPLGVDLLEVKSRLGLDAGYGPVLLLTQNGVVTDILTTSGSWSAH